MSVMFSLVIVGVVSSYLDTEWFKQNYVAEDGLIEWGTVLPLVLVAAVSLGRIFRWAGKTRFTVLMGLAVLAFSCVFAAGEEISWGQRIFGIESPGFFQRHNAQGETNLHNMVVGETKINKLIFSQVLAVVMALYLLALPWLYRSQQRVRHLVDAWAVPVPRLYHIGAFVLLYILTSFGPSGKKAELLEFGGAVIFALIVIFPLNRNRIGPTVEKMIVV
jgi:hypothetical protein